MQSLNGRRVHNTVSSPPTIEVPMQAAADHAFLLTGDSCQLGLPVKH